MKASGAKKKPTKEDRRWAKLERLMTKRVYADVNVQYDLDGCVHDVKSNEASNLNNCGVNTQLQFLRESGWSIKQVLKEMCLEVLEKDLVEPG